MVDSHVEARVDGHVASLILSNPPRHTINARGSQQLFEHLEALSRDDSVRVVVLTGSSEDIFVRHYEVDELADSSERIQDRRPQRAPVDNSRGTTRAAGGLRGAMNLLESMKQITVAAINGMAHGGGLELALACDFRLARAGRFTLGLPETGVGILPGGGGTQRLTRIVGIAQALDLVLHGTIFESRRALEMGIVHRVFPNPIGEYRAAVSEFAENLAHRAPIALAKAKQAIREGMEMSLSDGLRREAELFAELMATQDAARALRSVSKGKPIPRFKGE